MSLINFKERPLRKFYPSFFDDFIFDDFLTFPVNANGFKPATNIEETEKEFKLEMAIPGMTKDDIKVEVDRGILKVSAEKEEKTEEKEKNYTRKEYNYNSFERTFSLPENVTGSIDAKYESGILYINLPKKEIEVSQVKKIKVA